MIAPDAVLYLQISSECHSAPTPGMHVHTCGLPLTPTLCVCLTVEEAAKRGGFGEERYEKVELQQKVKEKFDAMRDETWHTVDANQPMDAVQAAVATHAATVVEACRAGKPLRYF